MLRKAVLPSAFSLFVSFSCPVSASECSPYGLHELNGKTASRVKIQFIKTSSDIQKLREILSHPEMNVLFVDDKITPDKIEAAVVEYVNGVLPGNYSNSIAGYFGIYVSDKLVGFADLIYFSDENQTSIHYGIAHEHWGQGLATESARILVQFAFEDLQVDSIFAVIGRSNKASIRVVEKVGFVRGEEDEGISPPHDYYYLDKENFSP